MLSSLKNASLVGHKTTLIPWSKLNEDIIKALVKDGYVNGYTLIEVLAPRKRVKFTKIVVTLKYDDNGSPVLRYIRCISKPSVRVYADKRGYKTKEQYGTLIVSTNHGVMSHLDAKALGLGGEVFFEVGC
jgi:small subunit ribosomal protein S8